MPLLKSVNISFIKRYDNAGYVANLRGWCLPLITSKPVEWHSGQITQPPVWGSCPRKLPGLPMVMDIYREWSDVEREATIILTDETYTGKEYTIDWNDGEITTGVLNAPVTLKHNVANTRSNLINIYVDGKCIVTLPDVTEIKTWGSILKSIYIPSPHLRKLPLLAPPVTVFDNMLEGATKFRGNLSKWDVSNVTSMKAFLKGAAVFDRDISNWDVLNITTKPVDFDTGTKLTLDQLPQWGGST